MTRFILRTTFLASFVLSAPLAVVSAQDSPNTFTAGLGAIVLLTRSTVTPQGGPLAVGYLTQPLVSADWRKSWLHAAGMLNLEGVTLPKGELDLGAWGEGYVDRRHPHAYVHELMLGVEPRSGSITTSLYAGRGFVPFGSDDPMTRPFVSYPVDHHLAQILERLILVAAVRNGPLVVEGATFNGDEPVDPSTPPLYRRFGDSWSVRGTLFGDPLSSLLGAELSASYANVKSPEYREGQGMDQRKVHASVRVAGENAGYARYALIEIARTTDVDRGRALYTFDAFLTEAAVCRDDLGLAVRGERSYRPEEERLNDLSRSPRPATDLSILGITQWTTLTAALSLPALRAFAAHAAPYVEVARISADRTTGALFDPRQFYGTNQMWRLSAGLRFGVGHAHGRAGRYGVASEPAAVSGHDHHASSTHHCFS